MQELRTDVERRLGILICTGYHDAQEALSSLKDDIAAADGDRAWRQHLAKLAKQHEARKIEQEKAWLEPSVNDRIDSAFRELQELRIVALQNVGHTLDEGWEDVVAVAEQRGGQRGAVFFHGQDIERAVAGEGLLLAFGSLDQDADLTDEAAVAIGHEICKVLRLHGLVVDWNGQVDMRLHIPPFEWRKRRFSVAAGHDLLVFACTIEHRLKVLKTCRSVLGLDLATAKAGLDGLKPRTYRWDTSPPWIVMRGLAHADATRFAEALIEAGAEVEVR